MLTIFWVSNVRFTLLLDDCELTEGINDSHKIFHVRRIDILSYFISTGDILYLKDKKKKGAKEFAGIPHTIEVGQSLYDVSQMYGVHLKNLYQLNALDADYVAKPGDLIWVR